MAERQKVDQETGNSTGKAAQVLGKAGEHVCPTLLVVITGGSKGIGKACVESFAQRGARVLFTYCSDAASAAHIEGLYQPPGRVQAAHLDQGDFLSVRTFASRVDTWRSGRQLNTLVNNAALGVATVRDYGALPSASAGVEPGREAAAAAVDDACRRAEEDMALMRVNALGPMWVTEALLPMMMSYPEGGATESGGAQGATETEHEVSPVAATPTEMGDSVAKKQTVLFIGSVGGGSQSVFPGFRAADAMSKAALAYACKHFAARSRRSYVKNDMVAAASAASAAAEEEGASIADDSGTTSAVDFLCLCPGATLTDMFKASTLDKMTGPGERERFVRALPQRRLIQPEEVAETVYWMCSNPATSMFHGAIIDASAGLAVRPGSLTEYSF